MKSIVQNVLFTSSECDYFKNLIDFEDIKKMESKVKGSFNLLVGAIPPSKIPNWFSERIKQLGVLDIKFGDGFNTSRCLGINRYSVGGYFRKHKDTTKGTKHSASSNINTRYKTLAVHLSNEHDSIGGDFTVGGIITDRTIGNCIIFDSSIDHEVLEIEKGTRYSLTLWLDRNDINEVRSLI